MDYSQFDLKDPFIREAIVEDFAQSNGLDVSDPFVRSSIDEELFSQYDATKPVDYERTFLGDTVSHLARGGVELLDTTAHMVDTAVGGSELARGASDYLGNLKQNAEILRPDQSEVEGEGLLKRGYASALESAPMSAGVWGGAAAGAAVGSAIMPGPGTVAGGLLGGAAAMGGLFGVGTYGKRKEEVVKELRRARPDLSDDQIEAMAAENAKQHAYAETLGETAGDAVGYVIMSRIPGGKAIYKGGKAILKELVAPNALKTIGKGIVADLPFEVASEVGTSYFQNEADTAIGINQMSTKEAMVESIIPAIFLSTGLGVGLGGYNAVQRKQALNGLNSQDQGERLRSVDAVTGTISGAADNDIAKKWRDMALGYVQRGERIPLDYNVAELAATNPEANQQDVEPSVDILEAESVDDAIESAVNEMAAPVQAPIVAEPERPKGWLQTGKPDMEESAWTRQAVSAKAYNQGRNELGATPSQRARLMGTAKAEPKQPDQYLLESTFANIAGADQERLIRMSEQMPNFVETNPEYRPYQKAFSDAITTRQRELWEQNDRRTKIPGDQGEVDRTGGVLPAYTGRPETAIEPAGNEPIPQPEQQRSTVLPDLAGADSGQPGVRGGDTGSAGGANQDLIARATQHIAETNDWSMGGLSMALDVDIDTAADLLDAVKADKAGLPRNIGANTPATRDADIQGFLRDQTIRSGSTGTATAAPSSDPQAFIDARRQNLAERAEFAKPARMQGESAREYLARKREFEAGQTVSQNVTNLVTSDERRAEADNFNDIWRDRSPRVASPTALKSGRGSKEYAIPGIEELRVTVKPPSGNKAKHTKMGWSVYVGNELVWSNLPGVADTAENAIKSATGKLKRIHTAIAEIKQAQPTPKATSTSDLPGAGSPDIVGKDRADRIANAKVLVGFLEANAAKDLDTGYESGQRVAYTGEDAPEGMRSFIYLEGPKAGAYGVAATPEKRSADAKAKNEAWQRQQDEFKRVRESGQPHAQAEREPGVEVGAESAQGDAKDGAARGKSNVERDGFIFSKDDVSYERARQAHYWTSHVPDKRGRQEQEMYEAHMQGVVDSLLPLAKTDEQKAELREWFNGYYRPGYLKRLNAQLDAASRTMSSMIAGPANFPVARNKKALDVESRRMSELVEWSKKSFAKMRAKLNGSEAISSTDVDAKEKLEKKLAGLIDSQETMKAANKIIRDKTIDDKDRLAAIVAVGVSEKSAEEILKPDYMGRIGFAPYSLQTNNAEIRRIKERIAELDNREQKAEETGGSVEKEFDGGRVELNYKDGYIRIFHDAKPDKETREKLKRNGFRWTPSESAWRRKLTLNGKYAAEQVTGVQFSEAEQTKQADGAPKLSTTTQPIPESDRADIPGEIAAAFGKLRARVLMRKITVLGSQEEAKALVARLRGLGVSAPDDRDIKPPSSQRALNRAILDLKFLGSVTESTPNDVVLDGEVEGDTSASPFILNVLYLGPKNNGIIQGLTATVEGAPRVYLVADGIAKNQAVPVLLHELGEHAARLGFAQDAEYQSILKSLEARQHDDTGTGKAIRAALARVPDDTRPEHKWSEVAAYLIENNANSKIGIVRRILAFFKRWLYKAGRINADKLTVEDLVLFARSATLAHTGATYQGMLSEFLANAAETMTPQLTPALQYSRAEVQRHAKAFYSKLQQVAADKFGGMKAQSVEPFLLKQGVKKAEIEATGLREWLAAMKPTDKVTKEQLADFVRTNTVEFEDVVLGGGVDVSFAGNWVYDRDGDFYTLRGGGENGYLIKKESEGTYTAHPPYGGFGRKKEGFSTLDEAAKWVGGRILSSSAAPTHFSEYTEPGAIPGSYREMFVTAPVKTGRADAMEMYDMGFIEESEIDKMSENVVPKWQDGHSQYSEIANPIVRIRFNEVTGPNGERILRVEEMQGPSPENQAKMPKHLKDNIYQTGVKRILAYAKENGFDGVALATKPGRTAGETQADRYSLEKHIERIEWSGEKGNRTWAATKGENVVASGLESEAESYLGKEIARKIIDTEGLNGEITGIDLRVGGEGLKQLYDTDLPNIFKSWGGQRMGSLGGMPFLPVSEKTADSFPMFSRALPQTATEAFKRWFGNSKITKNGEPHILYHGTQHPHFLKAKEYPWIFDQTMPRNPGNSDLSGLGIFLGGMDAAEMHAGFEGTVHPFYVRMEKPYVTTAAELEKKVAASGAEAFKKRLQDLNGHDGIIIKDRGHAIVFDANQVKSAEQNTGAFSREENDVRYSVAAKEYDEIETEIKEKVSEKYDMLPGARLFVTPEYSLVKTDAGKRAFDAARRRTEDKFELGNLILDGTTPHSQWTGETAYQDHFDETHNSFINGLDAISEDEYTKANKYVIDTDKPTSKAFGVKHIKGVEVKTPDGKHVGFAKDKTGVHDIVAKHHRANYGEKSAIRMIDYQKEDIDKWVVLDRERKSIGRYDDESDAIVKMMDSEQQWLVENGYSEGEAKAARSIREVTNRAFDLRVAELRKIEAEREKLGMPPLEIEIPDETKRYAVKDKRGNVVTTYEHLDDAERHLKELSKYKPGFSNVKVVRQTDSEIMRPGTINDYISVIGDLRGRYFPRQRQSGGVVLLAVNEKTGQKYRNNYDLWIGKGRKYGQDGEEVSENRLLSYARGRFNALTPLGRKIRELQKDGFSVTVEKAERMPEEVFDVVGLTASINALMDESLKDIKTREKATPGIEAAYSQLHKMAAVNLSNIFKERGGLSSGIRRNQNDYWEGFETDMKKAIVQYARTVAGTTAKRTAAQRITMALAGRDMSFDDFKGAGLGETWEEFSEFVNDRKLDPKKQANLYKEAMSWFKEIMRNDEQADRIIGTLKGLATLKYMGLRVSSAAVNLTNLVQAVPATISHYSGGSISSALRQVTASLKVLADYKRGTASDLDKRIITEIKERGLDSAQFNHEAAAVLRSKVGNMGAKVADTMMWMFSKTERINRAATIHAAYMELKRTNDSLSHEKLMEKAIEVSNRAHGLYGDETAPVWTRGSGNPLRMTFTFAKFSQNYMLNMASMIGKKDYKNAAYMLLSPAILGGAGASLATPVLAALASAFGIGGDDPEEELYAWAAREFGSDSFFRHGVPGLANINIKGSLAMNNPMPTTLEDVFGAPGSVIFDLRDAAREVKRGAYGKAFEKTLPSAIVSPFKAAREYDEGVTTGSYSRVYYGDQPLKGTGYDAVLRGLSFNPSRLSGIREKQWREDKIARKYRAERNDINSKFKKAWISGNGKIDRGDWLELMDEVDSYNERVQGLGMPDITPITKKSLLLMLRRQAKPNKRERMRQ